MDTDDTTDTAATNTDTISDEAKRVMRMSVDDDATISAHFRLITNLRAAKAVHRELRDAANAFASEPPQMSAWRDPRKA